VDGNTGNSVALLYRGSGVEAGGITMRKCFEAKVDHVGVDFQALRVARAARLDRLHRRIYQACVAKVRQNRRVK